MVEVTFLIMILGIATVILSTFAAVIFFRTNSKSRVADLLSSALGWQLVGEAIMGYCTLAFATAAFTGVLEGWSVEWQCALRFIMFFATASTTWHLVRTIKRL